MVVTKIRTTKKSPDVQFKELSLTKHETKPITDYELIEQKSTSEKANLCSNTVFSLYFKIRAKKIFAAKSLAFSLHFLFRPTSPLQFDFKNHENVNRS